MTAFLFESFASGRQADSVSSSGMPSVRRNGRTPQRVLPSPSPRARAALPAGILRISLVLTGLVAAPAHAHAEFFGGIDFPQGVRSFADAVLRFDQLHSGGPAPDPSIPNISNPSGALGPPDFVDSRFNDGYATLGRGGLIELRFVDNLLTNSGSGNTLKDLHIFEIGPDVEDTFVAIRPTAATLLILNPALDADGDGFFEIGKVTGSTSSIDIDLFFTGFAAGGLQFDAVQLIDDPAADDQNGPYVGADIDAVGALSSVAVRSAPEPASIVSLAIGAAFFGLFRTARVRRRFATRAEAAQRNPHS